MSNLGRWHGAGRRICMGFTALLLAASANADDLGLSPPGQDGVPSDDHARASLCLAEAVYYEAGSEPRAGQEAVAEVVLNRLHNPRFPKTVCGVVFQGAQRTTGCQFTFTCDGSLGRAPDAKRWLEAQAIAIEGLDGQLTDHVGASTHYHARWMTPWWAPSMSPTTSIGGHIFYRSQMDAAGSAALRTPFTPVQPEPVAPRPPRKILAVARTRPMVARPALPRPSSFSVWGLQVATVTPAGPDLKVEAAQ